MRFSPSLSSEDIGPAITRAYAIGTPAGWQNAVKKISEEIRHNPFAVNFFSDRYSFELAMQGVREYRRKTDRVPDITKVDPETHRLCAFAAMLSAVHERLPPSAQKTLEGRVKGGLTDDVGLAPLAFELLVASHLLQKGADVEWHDFESGGFDFLVRRGSSIVEVECKTFSADIADPCVRWILDSRLRGNDNRG